MEYKTNLAKKISTYVLENKFYVREIARGRNYYNANHIKYMFSPKKEKIVIVFDKKEYSILYLKNNILKFECSCRGTGVCEHYIPSIFYLKDNCENLDELCSIDDMSYNVANMNVKELYNYLSRLVGPRNLLIDSLTDDFESNMEKMISKMLMEKSETDLIYKTIVMLSLVDIKLLKLNYSKKIFDLINLMKSFSWDYNIEGFTYITSKIKLIKIINALANNSEEEDYLNVLNFIITLSQKLKNNECYEAALMLKLDYLQSNKKDIEFQNTCLSNMKIKSVKLKYMHSQMNDKNYNNIIKCFDNDKEEEIKELYYEALINLHPNEETASKIINEYPTLPILKMLYTKDLVKDKHLIEKVMSKYTSEEKCEMYAAISDYESLLGEAAKIDFSVVMKYSQILFENYKEGFIPYFERVLYNGVRRRCVKEVVKYLRMINGYKFGGYYVTMFLKYIFEEYIPYDDLYRYECLESELNV